MAVAIFMILTLISGNKKPVVIDWTWLFCLLWAFVYDVRMMTK